MHKVSKVPIFMTFSRYQPSTWGERAKAPVLHAISHNLHLSHRWAVMITTTKMTTCRYAMRSCIRIYVIRSSVSSHGEGGVSLTTAGMVVSRRSSLCSSQRKIYAITNSWTHPWSSCSSAVGLVNGYPSNVTVKILKFSEHALRCNLKFYGSFLIYLSFCLKKSSINV